MVGEQVFGNFQKILNQLNINLEIIETNSYKLFFDKLVNGIILISIEQNLRT